MNSVRLRRGIITIGNKTYSKEATGTIGGCENNVAFHIAMEMLASPTPMNMIKRVARMIRPVITWQTQEWV